MHDTNTKTSKLRLDTKNYRTLGLPPKKRLFNVTKLDIPVLPHRGLMEEENLLFVVTYLPTIVRLQSMPIYLERFFIRMSDLNRSIWGNLSDRV